MSEDKKEKLKEAILMQQHFLQVMKMPTIAILVAGLLVYLFLDSEKLGTTLIITGALLGLIVSYIFKYLDGKKKEDIYSLEYSKLNKMLTLEIDSIRTSLEIEKEIVEELSEKLKIYENKEGLSKEEKEQIISMATDKISEEVVSSIFSDKTLLLQADIEKKISLESLMKYSEKMIIRLTTELARLNRNSIVNLILGISITFIGVLFLFDTINTYGNFSLVNDKTALDLILPFIPRFTLVVFIEIFAYFFLRLYKENLVEIKYFQNELTNIESKMMAVEVAYITKNDEALKEAISGLTNTERNHVFKKGETTVELERAKSDSEMSKSMINGVSDILKSFKK